MAGMLYYPGTNPPDEIIYQAVLYWDFLSSIVPREHERYLSDSMRWVADAGLYEPIKLSDAQHYPDSLRYTYLHRPNWVSSPDVEGGCLEGERDALTAARGSVASCFAGTGLEHVDMVVAMGVRAIILAQLTGSRVDGVGGLRSCWLQAEGDHSPDNTPVFARDHLELQPSGQQTDERTHSHTADRLSVLQNVPYCV